MAVFVVTNAARIAMVLIVMGTWAGLAQLAGALMRPTYNAGLITLRTATKGKRNARLNRVVATPWMYTIVFIMLLTSFIGMGILMQDTADFFGFQKHVLSWEYVLHPKYVVILCCCGLTAVATALARFSRAKVKNAAAYDAAHAWAFNAFMATGVVGFLFVLMLESSRTGPSAQGDLPSGPGVAKALALLIAARAPLAGFGGSGASKETVQRIVDARMEALGVAGGTQQTLKAFSASLPRRVETAMRTLQGRMVSNGFDLTTTKLTATELAAAVNRLKMGARRRSGARLNEMPGVDAKEARAIAAEIDGDPDKARAVNGLGAVLDTAA